MQFKRAGLLGTRRGEASSPPPTHVLNDWPFKPDSTILKTAIASYASFLQAINIFARRLQFMTVEQLIFIGLNGYALALNRDTA